MKTRLFTGLFAAIFCVLVATSCSERRTSIENVKAGQPVTGIKFGFTSPDSHQIEATKASAQTEGQVLTLSLYFFDKSKPDSKPYVFTPETLTKKSQDLTTGHFLYDASITAEQIEQYPTMTSGEYYLYAIANERASFCSVDLNALKNMTRAQFEDYCVLKRDVDIDILGTSILMTGRYGAGDGSIVLKAGENILTEKIHLRRIAAKIRINFFNGSNDQTTNVSFRPKSFRISRYSRSSTLFERQGWKMANDKNGSVDNAKGTYLAAGHKQSAYESNIEKIVDLDLNNYPSDGIEFYMLENVQNPATSPGNWQYASRDKRDYTADQAPFVYAPEDATYVTVYGDYSDSEYVGEVQYTIHLGDFSSASGSNDNFTVRRNITYDYNVTVNGVSSIIVEACTGEERQPGAEGQIVTVHDAFIQTVDSHYETILLKIKNPGSVDAYSINIRTPYDEIIQTNDGQDSDVEPILWSDYKWIQFGRPASKTELKPYDPEDVVYIYDLLYELEDGLVDDPYNHYIFDDDYIYVTAYINEFYYEMELDLSGTEIALYNNMNDIFMNEKNEKSINHFINIAENRSMTVALSQIQKSPDGRSTFADNVMFQINQRPIMTMNNIHETSYPLGIESVEEQGALYLSSSHQEPSGLTLSNVDGRSNQMMVLIPGEEWSKYVDLAHNGYIDGVVAGSSSRTQMMSDYNYGLYACASRNRDLNGDGYIDPDEIKWYLPTFNQSRDIWNGASSLSEQLKFSSGQRYFTSNSGNDRIWWAKEGSAYGSVKGNSAYVRCVRTINDSFLMGEFDEVKELFAISSATDELLTSALNYENKIVVKVENLAMGTAVRSGEFAGEYDTHFVNAPQDKLPQYLQFAKEDLVIDSRDTFTWEEVTTGLLCSENYTESASRTDRGQWRIPNEKELGLLYKYLDSYSADYQELAPKYPSTYNVLSPFTASRTKYHRESPASDNVYYVQRGSGGGAHFITTDVDNVNSNSTNIKVRCVRDYFAGSDL